MPSKDVPHLAGSGEFAMAVVGERFHQPAIEKAVRRYPGKSRVKCPAEIYLEPNNPADPNAVRVEILGETVGYLSRYMALSMRTSLTNEGIALKRFGVDAVITIDDDGENLGVWLDLDLVEEDDEDEEEDDE